jgi:hypothetical protein
LVGITIQTEDSSVKQSHPLPSSAEPSTRSQVHSS